MRWWTGGWINPSRSCSSRLRSPRERPRRITRWRWFLWGWQVDRIIQHREHRFRPPETLSLRERPRWITRRRWLLWEWQVGRIIQHREHRFRPSETLSLRETSGAGCFTAIRSTSLSQRSWSLGCVAFISLPYIGTRLRSFPMPTVESTQ